MLIKTISDTIEKKLQKEGQRLEQSFEQIYAFVNLIEDCIRRERSQVYARPLGCNTPTEVSSDCSEIYILTDASSVKTVQRYGRFGEKQTVETGPSNRVCGPPSSIPIAHALFTLGQRLRQQMTLRFHPSFLLSLSSRPFFFSPSATLSVTVSRPSGQKRPRKYVRYHADFPASPSRRYR